MQHEICPLLQVSNSRGNAWLRVRAADLFKFVQIGCTTQRQDLLWPKKHVACYHPAFEKIIVSI